MPCRVAVIMASLSLRYACDTPGSPSGKLECRSSTHQPLRFRDAFPCLAAGPVRCLAQWQQLFGRRRYLHSGSECMLRASDAGAHGWQLTGANWHALSTADEFMLHTDCLMSFVFSAVRSAIWQPNTSTRVVVAVFTLLCAIWRRVRPCRSF